MKRNTSLLAILASALVLHAASMFPQSAATQATAPPAASAVPPSPDPWPKSAESNGATYTMYQPQLDDWDQYTLTAHAAMSVLAAGAKDPVFGVIEFEAKTHVSRATRTVAFHDVKVTDVKFPTVPDAAYQKQYQQEIQKIISSGPATMPLDRLEAELAIVKAEKKSRAVPVRNAPPAFVFVQSPSILVAIDGDPVWTAVANTKLVRVLNSRALILKDASGSLYVHVLDGFLKANALSGPWTIAAPAPAGAEPAAAALGKDHVVDLLEGTPDPTTKKSPSLLDGPPQLVVATTPTELIVTQGAPDWTTLEGTQLLYVKNTTGNVFQDLLDQKTYVLVTGRWFRAPGLSGPWESVAAKGLPAEFQAIPDDSPKENVKASIPGTTQAQEAVIADQIAETADVDRQKTTFQPKVSGSPDLKPIPDTTLYYVANSATPIIQVAPASWYACQAGVWYAAPAMSGPWAVASSVPASIYSIPPSSPIYYVTYVKIYDVTPSVVVVGYTPGYMGTVVTADGVVVYGTGYAYTPYITTSVWFPPPLTYGYAAAVTYTPWTGWAMGFGFGFAMGAAASSWYHYPYWGCAPYWGAMPYAYHGAAYGAYGGAAAWGPGGWAATSGNVYHQYGATSAVTRSSGGYNAWTGNAWSSKVGTSYNSVTGRASAGQQASVANAYTGNYASGERGASYNPNTGVTTRAGSATAGNAYTGQQGSAKWASATGPNGQHYGAADVNGNYYGSHDGSVYKTNGSGGVEQYSNGSWNQVQKPQSSQAQSFQSQEAARNQGEQRSAAASSSGNWGSGFGDSGKGWGSSGGGWGGSGGSGFSHDGSGSAGGSDRGGGGGFQGGGGGGWNHGGSGWGGGGGGGGFQRGGGGGGGSFGGGGFGGFHGRR